MPTLSQTVEQIAPARLGRSFRWLFASALVSNVGDGLFGGMAMGAPIGGLLAGQLGITAPFWFGFVGSAVLVALLWRQLAHIAHAGEPAGA